jgi:pimeloyl-ACP methyl ester carboxylesterase
MNIRKKNLGIALLFLTGVLMVTSCRKSNSPSYNYFVSKELVFSYSSPSIESFMDLATQTYPQFAELKPYIETGTNIYKVVFNTAIDGEDIRASGLVCMPSEPGNYPVLSFQNGTNTVNAFAPTNLITNPTNQMIQFISSMGFVVLISDYPGFGESFQIPHPYLISEPTVRSVIDLMRAVNEVGDSEFPGIGIINEYYLMGYSQGGWATLALHKSLEREHSSEFNLAGSVCGAGPYNMYNLLIEMINLPEYKMPSYLGYIINAYSAYHQFTNPVTDILNEPFASKLGSLYNGTQTLDQINSQLTTSIAGLLKQEFISGFATDAKYSTVRDALIKNSVEAWNSVKPLYFLHGEGDTHVNVSSTLTIYDAMIAAGTSPALCKKTIIPYLDHGNAVVPCMAEGLKFLIGLRNQ